MLDVTRLTPLQRALSCGLYPLSNEFQVVAIARHRNFNMINILRISRFFSQPSTGEQKSV